MIWNGSSVRMITVKGWKYHGGRRKEGIGRGNKRKGDRRRRKSNR